MSCPAGAVVVAGVCSSGKSPAPETVHRSVNRILAERQFHHHTSPVVRAYDWVGEHLSRLFAALFENHGLSVLGLVVAGTVTALAVVAAIRFVRRTHRDAMAPGPALVAGSRPAVEWDAEAGRHEARGEWRDALRCRYRALVAELGRRGLLDEVPGRTAGEYSRQVAERMPAGSETFRQASDMFQAAWYGLEQAGPHDVEVMRRMVASLLEQHGSPR